MERSSLAEDICVKTRKSLQNTDLHLPEFLVIDKVLQTIQSELTNNALKLTERVRKISKKLKKVEENPTYSVEQRQLYRDRLSDLNTEY